MANEKKPEIRTEVLKAVVAERHVKKEPDASLAGTYQLTHGSLFMGGETVLGVGSILRLSAEDAERMLARKVVRRVDDSSSG